jgi:tetratricopeptide (TPR) repeat protein
VLTPLARIAESLPVGRDPEMEKVRVAVLNLHGVCACMVQDFDRAIRTFTAALKTASNKAWLYQNLALVYEFKGRSDQAETHWNRYFDLLDGRTPAPPIPNYLELLAFAGLCRLAEMYSKQERIGSAVTFLQRAHRLRPRDTETLEKLFQLYHQSRRPEDARRVLQRLREIRPNDPQFEMYELDLVEIRSMDDVDRILGEIKRILGRHPGDHRVEDRALHTVINLAPLIGRKCEQLSEQLAHIANQVRSLPNYQINWPVVHDEMRFLRFEFQKMRKLCTKCVALINHEEQRRVLRDLMAQIDNKINICVSMGG